MKYKLNEDKVLFTELENEGVLFNITTNEYFNVNETFKEVLSGFEDNKTTEEIKDMLLKTYDVSEKEAQNSIEEVVNYLKERNYIITL